MFVNNNKNVSQQTKFSTTSYSSLTRKIVLFALFAHLDAHYTKKCRPYTGSFGQFLTDCLESESTFKKKVRIHKCLHAGKKPLVKSFICHIRKQIKREE